MKRLLPIVIGIMVAVACGWLGFWQLDRLDDRRTANAVLAPQLADTVMVEGVFLFAQDSVVRHRAYRGVPGVWILTPFQSGDRVFWVNRGFAPSPDSRTIDLTAYREPEVSAVVGVQLDGVLRRVALPPNAPERLVAVAPPTLDGGPHLSYAVQWFIFGVIALVGGAILALRSRP